jgi:type VI secretion system protein ImpK
MPDHTVYPILRYGLRLLDRLRLKEAADIDTEQNELKRLFGQNPSQWTQAGPEGSTFVGYRYALACWLDDVFILDPDSPWREAWRNKSIEVALFGEALRAGRFWEQCRLAERAGDVNALEVYYLCVMLGFRGDLRDDPDGLQRWREAVEGLVAQGQATDWQDRPPDLPLAETHVPPLRCRERLRWLYGACAALAGLAIFIGAFALVLHSSK